MRMLLLPLILTSLCATVVAQVPTDAATKPVAQTNAAEAAFKELAEMHQARMRKVQRGDTEGRNQAMQDRMADLQEFAKQYPQAAEANKAQLEILQLSMTTKNEAAGKQALAAIDIGRLDMGDAVRTAITANQLGLADQKQRFLDTALTKAKTVDERFELVNALRLGLKDEAAADKLLADIEASAKTPEDKASVLMGKVNIARRANRNDKQGYADGLAEVAKLYPETKAGKTAASKLAAANLAIGSDPVPFTTVDMDGKSVSPADYKGKVLLIDFWATWCGPCMAELPHVLEAYEQFHDQGFEILGISLDREADKEKLVSTIAERGMSWRHVYDGKYWQAEIAQLHDVNSIPFTLLLGKDGKVAGMNLRGKKLGEAVKAALEAN